jgi:transcriptional regulator with XRE-family HTH domain
LQDIEVIILSRIIDTPAQNIIGGNIKKLRIEKGLSQKQLSDKLEIEAVYICRGSISRIESGERTVSDIEILGLSIVLETSIERLFEGVYPNQPT